jgi:hypothetical protein
MDKKVSMLTSGAFVISMLCVALVTVKIGNWNLLTSIGYPQVLRKRVKN